MIYFKSLKNKNKTGKMEFDGNLDIEGNKKLLRKVIFSGVGSMVIKVKKLVGDIYEQNGVIIKNKSLKKEPRLTGKRLEEILSKIDRGEIISKKEKLLLIQRIERNNPIYSILTNLKRGDKFGIIIFKGIKELNDSVSQSFTDKVVNEFKDSIKKSHPEIKVIWNDWKNFVFKIPRNTNINQEAISKIMKNILVKNMKSQGIKADLSNTIKVASTSSIISGKTQEDLIHNIAYTRLSLERDGVRGLLTKKEIIKKERDLFDKYFNKKEEVQRKYLHTDGIYYIKKNNLIREFIVNGRTKKEKTNIFYPNGDINIDFITKVRKKEIPTNSDFYQDFKVLFDSYIARAEFLAPYIKRDNIGKGEILTQEEIRRYKKTISEIEKGEIRNPEKIRQLAENNYKNSLEKGIFYNKINKRGQLFYIDIKDMGSLNMKDFSDKINMWNTGELTAKEILLKSGDNMTIKFQNIVKELRKKLSEVYVNKNINISIGGDEIMVFVEGVENNLKAKKILENLFVILRKNQVEGRVTEKLIKDNELLIGGEKAIETLDKLTKKTKQMEKRIDIIGKNLLLGRKRITSLEENKEINKRISDLEKLRNFSLSIEDGEEYITFHNRPKDLEGKILLKYIINNEGNLKGDPPSPFTRYLDTHNLGRKRERK